jgi:transketolase
VLPPGVKRVAIEAAHPMPWYKWIGGQGTVLGIERYGASAPFERVYKELGLIADHVVSAALELLGKGSAPKTSGVVEATKPKA